MGQIARTWRGLARSDAADAYVQHLETTVFPQIEAIRGHRGARVLRRSVPEGVEFLVETLWDSMDAIRAFAGDDPERAVVEAEARALMLDFDRQVIHWEVASEGARA